MRVAHSVPGQEAARRIRGKEDGPIEAQATTVRNPFQHHPPDCLLRQIGIMQERLDPIEHPP